MAKGLRPNQELVASCIWQGWYYGQYCLKFSLTTWTMGQNAPLALLWMMPNWEKWLRCWREAPCWERPWQTGETGWRNGTTKKNAVLHLGQVEQGGLGTDGLGNVSTVESLRFLMVNGLEMNQQCTHAAVKANSILGYIGKDIANR